ncbi:MAG: long-chain fatty acid--CoA ligase [Alphaproteobacteria bacterium]|jgi:long-chain acyl-CoA synthetase|nr:long-chain fatty acid--CoA ligase [Alphaproteobacteria bacterium]
MTVNGILNEPAPFWQKSYPAGVDWQAPLKPRSLIQMMDDAVAKYGDKPFLTFMGKTYSYREVGELSTRFAKGLKGLGVGPGVQVGLYLPNCPFYPIAFFGIIKAGARVVNYSPLDAARELTLKIGDSETDYLVTLSLNALYPNVAKQLGQTRLKKVIVADLQDALPFPKNFLFPLVKGKEIAKVPRDDRHVRFKDLLANDGQLTVHKVADPSEEVAVLQYTGGTTGVPKAAMLTHANLTVTAQMYEAWTSGASSQLESGKERLLLVLPLFHIYALSAAFLRALDAGWHIILHPRFELKAVLDDLVKYEVSVFPGVPTMYAAIIAAPNITEYKLNHLKFCASGGAPLPVEVQDRFQALTGCKLLEGWGMTETSPAGTSNPLDPAMKPRRGSCGLPLPGLKIEIVDVDDPLKLLGPNERGEICIRGPNVMKGYWKKPEATEEAFLGGRFHSGDVGYQDEDGYIYIVDRKKDMILSGGFNVYPRNIEEAIYEHPAVAEVTVIGIPDDYRGQSAKAFIKLKDGVAPFTFDELKAFLKEKLGKHEMPAAMEIRPALPKTVVGKLSKKELVEEEMQKYEAGKQGAASRAKAG